jgi:hypothetical protein
MGLSYIFVAAPPIIISSLSFIKVNNTFTFCTVLIFNSESFLSNSKKLPSSICFLKYEVFSEMIFSMAVFLSSTIFNNSNQQLNNLSEIYLCIL